MAGYINGLNNISGYYPDYTIKKETTSNNNPKQEERKEETIEQKQNSNGDVMHGLELFGNNMKYIINKLNSSNSASVTEETLDEIEEEHDDNYYYEKFNVNEHVDEPSKERIGGSIQVLEFLTELNSEVIDAEFGDSISPELKEEIMLQMIESY